MKTLIIATAHSKNFKENRDYKIETILEGGSPYYTHFWINDELHTIYLTPRGKVKIEKTK